MSPHVLSSLSTSFSAVILFFLGIYRTIRAHENAQFVPFTKTFSSVMLDASERRSLELRLLMPESTEPHLRLD